MHDAIASSAPLTVTLAMSVGVFCHAAAHRLLRERGWQPVGPVADV